MVVMKVANKNDDENLRVGDEDKARAGVDDLWGERRF